MSNFDETVRRIAADPVKLAAYQGMAPALAKFAAAKKPPIKGIFGNAGGDVTGGQKVLGTIVGTAIGSLLGVAGSELRDKMIEMKHGNPLAYEEEHKELGKLRARTTFKATALAQFKPKHNEVLKHLKKEDELIKDAPNELVDSSFETMMQFAPLLAADKNSARSYLREAVASGVGPNYATIKNLVESEQAAQMSGGLIHK